MPHTSVGENATSPSIEFDVPGFGDGTTVNVDAALAGAAIASTTTITAGTTSARLPNRRLMANPLAPAASCRRRRHDYARPRRKDHQPDPKSDEPTARRFWCPFLGVWARERATECSEPVLLLVRGP